MRAASSIAAIRSRFCSASGASFGDALRERVGVDRAEEPRREARKIDARVRGDPSAIPVADAAVERGEARGERRERVLIATAGGDLFEQLLEADLAIALQRLRNRFEALGDADRVDQHEAGLGVGVGRHLAQLLGRDRARAPALHLLEILRRLHVAQEDQRLDRLHVGAGGDHVDGDGDARIVVVAELADQQLGIAAVGAIGDLLGEVVALAEHVAHDADDLLGVIVVLGEDERLRDLAAAGKELGEQRIAIGLDHGADLVRRDHRAVEVARRHS